MSMVVSRAPFRVSFFGGGSDYPVWYLREGGAVLSTTINKYIYITCRYLPPYLGTKHRVVWRHVEQVDSINEILHPAVRAALNYLGFDDEHGIELHYQGDLPSRAGMGSSSSFIVAMLQALHSLRGIAIDKEALAQMAIFLEQVQMKETVGSQDQIAAAYGGLNVIKFRTDNKFDVHPVTLSSQRQKDLGDRLMLFFPGKGRIASNVAASVVANLSERSNSVHRMIEMVHQGAEILRHGDLDDFGHLLHEGWELKRGLSTRVSSEDVDAIYDRARQAGAIGGKLLGAGETGFILLYVQPERREDVLKRLSTRCIHVPFKLDHKGASIIYKSEETAPQNEG
jgi:D-glycero-alpha-D-manno-heptose-7-phosphate kinase